MNICIQESMKSRRLFYCAFLILNIGLVFSQNLEESLGTNSSDLKLNEFLDCVKGIWILKSSGSNWGMNDISKNETDEILIINEEEISCYSRQKKSRKMELKWSEAIVFKNKVYSQNSNTIILSNYWIWNLTYLKENDTLYFRHAGELMANGMMNLTLCGNTEKIYQRFK